MIEFPRLDAASGILTVLPEPIKSSPASRTGWIRPQTFMKLCRKIKDLRPP